MMQQRHSPVYNVRAMMAVSPLAATVSEDDALASSHGIVPSSGIRMDTRQRHQQQHPGCDEIPVDEYLQALSDNGNADDMVDDDADDDLFGDELAILPRGVNKATKSMINASEGIGFRPSPLLQPTQSSPSTPFQPSTAAKQSKMPFNYRHIVPMPSTESFTASATDPEASFGHSPPISPTVTRFLGIARNLLTFRKVHPNSILNHDGKTSTTDGAPQSSPSEQPQAPPLQPQPPHKPARQHVVIPKCTTHTPLPTTFQPVKAASPLTPGVVPSPLTQPHLTLTSPTAHHTAETTQCNSPRSTRGTPRTPGCDTGVRSPAVTALATYRQDLSGRIASNDKLAPPSPSQSSLSLSIAPGLRTRLGAGTSPGRMSVKSWGSWNTSNHGGSEVSSIQGDNSFRSQTQGQGQGQGYILEGFQASPGSSEGAQSVRRVKSPSSPGPPDKRSTLPPGGKLPTLRSLLQVGYVLPPMGHDDGEWGCEDQSDGKSRASEHRGTGGHSLSTPSPIPSQ